MKKLLLFFLLFFVFNFSFGQPGSLDLSFGIGGKVTTDIASNEDWGTSVAIQGNGKIAVGGYSYDNISKNDFALVCYNSDGSLDNTFGFSGKVTTDFGNDNDYGKAIAIQNDGKIVEAGYSYNGFKYNFALARYNISGSLDNTFGLGGKDTMDLGGSGAEALSFAIQSDGKIVVAGFSSNGSNNDFALVRYNIDGSLDNTFGSMGIVTTDFGGTDDLGESIAIQNDGKIVVSGVRHTSTYDFALARYNNDGSLDNAFGIGGKVTTDFGSSDEEGFSVAIQYDGKIVVAGLTSSNFAHDDFALARYNSDGSLDNSFGSGGKVITSFSIDSDIGCSVAIQSDGKIVVAGTSWSSVGEFALVRYNTNGTLDNSFGMAGKVTTYFGVYGANAMSVAIQNDGKILLAGMSSNGPNYDDYAVARYNGGTVGISEIPNAYSPLSIYPNPFTYELTVKWDEGREAIGEKEIILYDVAGKEILRQKTTEAEINPVGYSSCGIKLNTEKIAAGFYLLKVGGENFKVIKSER